MVNSCGALMQAETTPSTPPDQLVWCGSDGAVLFWEVRASPSFDASRSAGWVPSCSRGFPHGARPSRPVPRLLCTGDLFRLLQGVGLLLVTLEGCWRWWEVGGAAVLAPEVDGERGATGGRTGGHQAALSPNCLCAADPSCPPPLTTTTHPPTHFTPRSDRGCPRALLAVVLSQACA